MNIFLDNKNNNNDFIMFCCSMVLLLTTGQRRYISLAIFERARKTSALKRKLKAKNDTYIAPIASLDTEVLGGVQTTAVTLDGA